MPLDLRLLSLSVLAVSQLTLGCESGASDGTAADGAMAQADDASTDGTLDDPMDAAAFLDAALMDAAGDPPDGALPDFVPEAADFTCMTDWTPVRRFYVHNTRGHLEEALRVANSPEGGTYPVGTILQLVPFEAMAKRAPGFEPRTNDWEFFSLASEDGQTVIEARGTDEVVNMFGGNCVSCHSKAEPKWDFVCETGHGCDPLAINEGTIRALQNSDPRCQ